MSYDEHLISMAGGDGDVLDQIQRRADKATEGPWKAERGGDFQAIKIHSGSLWIEVVDGSHQAPPLGEWIDSPDIDFIEAARTDIPALLAMVRERDARLDATADLISEWEKFAGPGSQNERVFGKQVISVELAVKAIRAALTTPEQS